MNRLEFWPDYGGVLLHAEGTPVALADLGLDADLVRRAQGWARRYNDAKLAPASWDESWAREGRELFRELRAALATTGIELDDWEGTWSAVAEPESE